MEQGVSSLVGTYEVCLGNKQVGKVTVQQSGLYYEIFCHCRLSEGILYRLHVLSGEKYENLGILVPEGDCFALKTRIPVKRFEAGKIEFLLIPKYERGRGQTVPIYPDEPFAYISRLKGSYLTWKNGQMMINIK